MKSNRLSSLKTQLDDNRYRYDCSKNVFDAIYILFTFLSFSLPVTIRMERHKVPESVQASNQIASGDFISIEYYANTGKRRWINKVKLQTKKQL